MSLFGGGPQEDGRPAAIAGLGETRKAGHTQGKGIVDRTGVVGIGHAAGEFQSPALQRFAVLGSRFILAHQRVEPTEVAESILHIGVVPRHGNYPKRGRGQRQTLGVEGLCLVAEVVQQFRNIVSRRVISNAQVDVFRVCPVDFCRCRLATDRPCGSDNRGQQQPRGGNRNGRQHDPIPAVSPHIFGKGRQSLHPSQWAETAWTLPYRPAVGGQRDPRQQGQPARHDKPPSQLHDWITSRTAAAAATTSASSPISNWPEYS
ncbi:Uncharacterised protein [Mycobacteroides abscessus subsp. massiliense]|nr:Uncharacterised protein [Mycobacteroides abscessus subsp. massiliense]